MDSKGASDGEARHAVLAAGGSGGHVFPALAVAAELCSRGWRVSLIGRRGQIEARLAERHGLEFHPLEAAPVLGRSSWGKVRSLLVVLGAALRARRSLRRIGADAVVGFGGYVSAPAVLAAYSLGLPTLLFEPNARVGLANRWLSRLARGAAIAYPEASARLGCPATVTGTPVRAVFFDQPAEPPDGSPSLLVLGGSQGARQLNEMVPRALALLGDEVAGLEVLHQAGAGNVDSTEAAYREAEVRVVELRVVPFLEEMATALGRADLVVSRAGAITLAEICAVGRPSVLVPLEIAAAHQADNAAALVAAGAAELVAPGETESRLAERLGRLLASPELRRRMGTAAKGLARPDAAAAIADDLGRLREVA